MQSNNLSRMERGRLEMIQSPDLIRVKNIENKQGHQQSSKQIAPFVLSSINMNSKPQESLPNIANNALLNANGSRQLQPIRSIMSLSSHKINKRSHSSDKIHGLNEESKVINELMLVKDQAKSPVEDEKVQNNEDQSNQRINEQALTKIDQNEANEGVLCRFCWGSEISHLNPLLSSCKCNGGIKFIHYLCLKEWINSKRQVKEHGNVVTLMYKSFECELCKTPYPLFFKVGRRKYSLIDCQKRNGSYLTLDMLTLDPNCQRVLHIFQPS